MNIETSKAVYDVAINVVQIEITGRCNMKCLHCRGSKSKDNSERRFDMPVWAIKKVIDFAKKHSENEELEIVLSGGEPLLHPDLEEILMYCDEVGVYKEITTNGYLIDDNYIKMLKKYDITNISVSLDSVNPQKHDKFRQCIGSYEKAINAVKKLNENGISARIRGTISKENFDEMEDLVKQAMDIGASSIGFGPILPVGNAVNLKDIRFDNSSEMKKFIYRFFELKEKYKGKIDVITNECLHGLYYLERKDSKEVEEDNYELNGCTAGVVTFNVLLNGDITPCSMLHKKMANIYEDDDLDCAYFNSEILHNLLDRNFKGKCGRCENKYICGGCRVRAEYYGNDYLEEDKMCWIQI